MFIETPSPSRQIEKKHHSADFVVVGGGLAGVCAAIAAARRGLRVTLVQDRPVLGGNGSSEVRLWALGATSHMGNNNRWSREGGVIDEILVENLHRNPEGNPVLFDMVLLDAVLAEERITLLLNTAVFSVAKKDDSRIASVTAFCSQTETLHEISAPYFCDASGDGVVGFQAGAAFRIGAEAREEFGEKFAPDKAFGELLGHTIFFYSKDVGHPVRYIAPKFALKDITKIPRFGQISARDLGCQFWWLEFGGRFDTIHQTEEIKWELWRVVYGVWDHIKNSGKFPEAENLTLEWVGTVPGKRESRRFEGDYMLVQQDVVEQRVHDDAVAFGGWAIDLHPADGVYSDKPGCVQMHSKGVYQIPYRTLYSRNIDNLFLAGRLISVSHVAFGSTRVMATTGHTGQAAGVAASLCLEGGNLAARDLLEPKRLRELQSLLLETGHYIPGVNHHKETGLAPRPALRASSSLNLTRLAPGGSTASLDCHRAMLLPLRKGRVPAFTIWAGADRASEISCELRTCSRKGSFTPDTTLATVRVPVAAGAPSPVRIDFDTDLAEAQYGFLCLMASEGVKIALSDSRVTGILSVMHGANKKVAKSAVQEPEGDIGVDRIEFWIPERRPGGRNFALEVAPGLDLFAPESVLDFPLRPTTAPNAWVASFEDPAPELSLEWPEAQSLAGIDVFFDPDHDHALESVQWGHPERVSPFCVPGFSVHDDTGNLVAAVRDNHQARCAVVFEKSLRTRSLVLRFDKNPSGAPAAVFGIFPKMTSSDWTGED